MDMYVVPRMFAKPIKIIKISDIEVNIYIDFSDSHLFFPRSTYVPSKSMTLIVCLIAIPIAAG